MSNTKTLNARETMTIRRERIAQRVFDLETIFEKIVEMANEGFSQLLIHNEYQAGVNLSGTEAAQEIDDILTAMGCDVSWVDRCIPAGGKGNKTGHDVIIREMLISWGGASPLRSPGKAARTSEGEYDGQEFSLAV